MGGHAGEPHGRLLGQVGAAAAVVRAGGMGVGAAGPRVAAVDAVQAAVGDKQSGGSARSGGGRERKGAEGGADGMPSAFCLREAADGRTGRETPGRSAGKHEIFFPPLCEQRGINPAARMQFSDGAMRCPQDGGL